MLTTLKGFLTYTIIWKASAADVSAENFQFAFDENLIISERIER